MNQPNVDLLNELFNSEEWMALKEEIKVCLLNAERELKQCGQPFREFKAGECTGYETVLKLENKYKNIEIKKDVTSN